MKPVLLQVSYDYEGSETADVVLVENSENLEALYTEYLSTIPEAPMDERTILEGFADWGIAQGHFHKTGWITADLNSGVFQVFRGAENQ